MIFEIVQPEKKEYAQAKSILHLLQEYYKEFGSEEFLSIKSYRYIDEEEAKTIMLKNNETTDDMPEEFSLYDTVVGDDFVIVGSTDWD